MTVVVPLKSKPIFKFGIISDIQWADIPDGASFHGVPRYYRNALVLAKRAVKKFKDSNVDFAIHLGDIVDYHNSKHGTSDLALREAIECFENLETDVLHCIGNHCLYNANRQELNRRLGIDNHKAAASLSGCHSYFSYRPPLLAHSGFRFLVLDGYDVSLLGWPEGHPLHNQARDILDQNNPNEDKNSNTGLEGLNKRFVKFGGGISDQQIAWLESELADARSVHDKVIVCCHLCMHPDTCAPTCLLYNYDRVLEILQKNSDVVVATLAGHAHRDGFCKDDFGINHRVCKAVLETEPGSDCYGIVSVYKDKIVVDGYDDTFLSQEWEISSLSSSFQSPTMDACSKEKREKKDVIKHSVVVTNDI